MYPPVNTSRTTRRENLNQQSVPLSESNTVLPSNFKPQSEFHPRSRRGRSPSVRTLPQAPTVSEGIYSNQNHRADSQALLDHSTLYSQNFGRGSLPGSTTS